MNGASMSVRVWAMLVCVTASVLCLALCSGGGAAAGEPELLLFEQTRIDVGPVSDGEPVKRGFKFTNASGRAVRLSIAHCSFCPAPETDKAEYRPGESGLVILELPTMGKHGPDEANAEVGVAGAPGSNVRITLAAEVRPAVRVEPALLSIREVVRSRGMSETLTVTGRKAGFEIVRTEAATEWLELSVGPARTVEDLLEQCTAYDVTVRVRPGAPLGPFEGRFAVFTNDPRRERIAHGFSTLIVGELTAEPARVSLSARRPGSVFAAEFDLLMRSGGALWLGDVELEVKPINGVRSCVLDAVPGQGPGILRVTVTGLAPERVMPIFDMPVTVTLRATGEKVTVPVRVNVRRDGRGG
jgi:hypothetical protein